MGIKFEGDFVAPLSEQQVRQLLITEIQNKAELNNNQSGPSPSVIDLVKGLGNPEVES